MGAMGELWIDGADIAFFSVLLTQSGSGNEEGTRECGSGSVNGGRASFGVDVRLTDCDWLFAPAFAYVVAMYVHTHMVHGRCRRRTPHM